MGDDIQTKMKTTSKKNWRRPQKKTEDDLKKNKMEDYLKKNWRWLKKMEDDLKNGRWLKKNGKRL